MWFKTTEKLKLKWQALCWSLLTGLRSCSPAKLRNELQEWQSAGSLVDVFGIELCFLKTQATTRKKNCSAVTLSDCKIRCYSVHTGTYAAVFGRIEVLSKLGSLQFRFLHSSSNSLEQHRAFLVVDYSVALQSQWHSAGLFAGFNRAY